MEQKPRQAVPRPASTVVLLRPSATRFEVFLIRRRDDVAFMGGAHVFPGGSVDPADRLDEPQLVCDGVDEAIARMPDVPPREAIAYHVAAVRELFEEAGVLLARSRTGRPVDRTIRIAPGSGLLESAQREGLRLSLDALVMFAHWVTPDIEIKRFDTRFFLATAPVDQETAHDGHEASDSVWLDPTDAIARCRVRTIALPPPTWTTLRALERFSNVDAAMAWARRRDVVRVQPGFITRDGLTVLTPGDPQHPAAPGSEVPAETRFVLEDKHWRPVTP